MWIVLLDYSESMGEPFRGSASFSGRSVTSAAATKFEAARSALLERVRGLAPNERVVVIAFTSVATIAFDDSASETARLKAALAELEPTNGTSIAAAFDATVELLKPAGKTNARVLLVSDCESDLAPAVASADRLIQLVHVIDVLLIDPDTETEKAARAMIRLGEVQAVVSPEELRTAVSDRDTASQQVANAVGRVIEDAMKAAQDSLEQQAHDRGEPVGSEVSFSVGYGSLLRPGQAEPLLVIIHPITLKKEVGELLERMLAQKTADPRIAADGRTRLPKGAEIRIEPVIPNVDINPRRMDVLWQDRIEDFRFTMTARQNAANTYTTGSVNVWYGPAQIACLPVAVRISSTEAPQPPTIQATGLYASVFPSYSRKDKAVVDRARGYYEALGIAVLQDTEALRALAGANWERALDALILKADAFQLYWSHSAAKSPQVEREWKFALPQSSFKNDRWIRPLRWMEDVPNLPEELAHLQMGRLPGVEDIEPARNAAAESIRCIVMPLVDCPPEQRRIVERECREAVYQVETVTGLRCYPPPVLLVDEYLLQQESPHIRKVDEELIRRFAAAADLLNAMSLDIHTGFSRAKVNGQRVGSRQPLNLSLSPAGRDLALSLAEWVFASALSHVLGINGYRQRRNYGVPDGLPIRVASEGLKPSERVAEFLSSQSKEGPGFTRNLSAKRSEMSDAAIDWMKEISDDLNLDVDYREQSVEMKATQGQLRTLMERALTPEVAAVIDRAKPLANQRPPDKTPALTVFTWLASSYFYYLPEADDCEALIEAIEGPPWQSRLESFATAVGYTDLDPIEMFEPLLQSLQSAFDEAQYASGEDSEFVTGYAITPESLDTISVEGISPRPEREWTYIAGKLPVLKQLFARASDEFMQALRVFKRGRGAGGGDLIEAHAYGAFIPAGPDIDRDLVAWAEANGVPHALTLPGSDRILLCMEPIRQAIEKLDDAGARRMVRRCVLIHEFLHATIWATARSDENRQAQLREARNVEEAVAVWLELDLSRDYQPMREVVEKYISAGQYSEWPYAGATVLEAKFVSGGRSAIQSFVQGLIDNPVAVQRTFDASFQS